MLCMAAPDTPKDIPATNPVIIRGSLTSNRIQSTVSSIASWLKKWFHIPEYASHMLMFDEPTVVA